MTTNPTIFGRSTALHASANNMPSNGADALTFLTRGLANALNGWSAISSTITVRRVDHRSRGLAAAVILPRQDSGLVPDIDSASVLLRLQQTSGLTLDELADVLNTSRRTLHNWKNGSAVNAANERRLRDVDHSVSEIARHVASVRDAIMAKRAGGVRVFDLLAESRFDAAVVTAGGNAAAVPTPPAGELDMSLAARLDPAGPIEPVGIVRVVKRPSRRQIG